jgi:hypothetical protein
VDNRIAQARGTDMAEKQLDERGDSGDLDVLNDAAPTSEEAERESAAERSDQKEAAVGKEGDGDGGNREDGGKDGGEGDKEDPGDPEPEDDPPLQSVDLPDLTFGEPQSEEPQLSSNDLPEVTYGTATDQPNLVSSQEGEFEVDLTFSQHSSSDAGGAVIFEGGDAAVRLDDASTDADDTEVGPQPDYPEPEDDEDQTGFGPGSGGHHTYEITASPFAHHDFTLVYQDDDDDEDDDDGMGG